MWEVNTLKSVALAGGAPKAWCGEASGYRLLFLGWTEQMAQLLLLIRLGRVGLLRARDLGLEMLAFPGWLSASGLGNLGWGGCVKTNSHAFGQVHFVLGTYTLWTSSNLTETHQ